MQIIFILSQISCLDESMSVWMNKLTCPRFVFYPRKPHPKGNEHHTICCGESGIIYGWQIVEVRDHRIPMGQPEFQTSLNMKKVVLMLRLKRALWSTGKATIMGSGFCVLKGILEMRKRGVYGIKLIKQRRYWPRGIYGYSINNSFRSKILVMWDVYVVNGTRQSLIFLF